MESLAPVAAEIARLAGLTCPPEPETRGTGGSINRCYRWRAGAGYLFVKLSSAAALPMFEAEAAGLAELALSRAVRVPRTVACGHTRDAGFLALEWLRARA